MELPTKSTVRFINDEPVTLAAYWRKLRGHDWYYSFSDDGSVYRAGSNNETLLRTLSQQSPAHKALYDGWVAHMFSGPSWGNEKAPQPPEPEDVQ